jgi:hypothetical protein
MLPATASAKSGTIWRKRDGVPQPDSPIIPPIPRSLPDAEFVARESSINKVLK